MEETYCSSLQTLLNAPATEQGETLIRYWSGRFCVQVDLDYKPGPIRAVYNMMLSLSNSETMLSSKCMTFAKYDCSAHQCKPTEKRVDFNYPFVAVNSQVVSAQVNLDYSSWILKTDAYLADNCESYESRMVGDIDGVIGLGTKGRASESFIGSKTFSIFLNTTGYNSDGSKLLFREDVSLAASDDKAVLHTDANWRTYFAANQANVMVGDKQVSFPSGKLIFDLHFDALGFPSHTYLEILSKLREYGIFCSDGTTTFCNGHVEEIRYFPKMILNVGGNSISIPPEMYVDYNFDEKYRRREVKLRGMGWNQYWMDWVPVEFTDTVIFGYPFMNYYYTVFKFTDSTNTISLYPRGPRGPLSFDSYIIPAVIILSVILAIVATVLFIRKRKKQAQGNPSTDGSLMNS